MSVRSFTGLLNKFMKKLWLIPLAIFLTTALMGEEKARREEKDENLYSSFGKRDPFRIPDQGGVGGRETSIDPLRKFRLEGYRLRAILRTGGKTQAMFEDPEGKSHVVLEGDRIGMEGARISRIVNSEVIVTERSMNYLGKETLLEKVISLPASADGKEEATTASSTTVQQGFSETKESQRVPANSQGNAPVSLPPGFPRLPEGVVLSPAGK